ncbi:BlaI/MecI/CopY family transcriptional regulator [candidate division GN15 bacterium]|nr:BlaI/MecI/CopY family transcriptional regulator [candidate division GN15 bacterium]
MARKKTPTLTEAELRIMRVIWDLEEASVNDVLAKLPASEQPAYNTVLTTMRILEQKGYLEHIKRGRAYYYRPLVDRQRVRRKALRHIMTNFFDGSPRELMLSILDDEKLSAEDLERLKQMIDDKDK